MGYVATTHSLAEVIRAADPATAHTLSPSNGAVTADLALHAITGAPQAGGQDRAISLARLALRQDPTAVDAIEALAIKKQFDGETAQSKELFRYSFLLSRRELRPQIWAIEESVNRGDINGALRNYDVALRTSNEARTLLFPVLTSSLTNVQIRDALLPIILTRPNWYEPFFNFAAKSGIEPQAVSQLFDQAEGLDIEIDAGTKSELVNAIAKAVGLEEAWAYYASFTPGISRSQSRDPNFALWTDTPTLFDWTLSQDPQLSVVMLRLTDSGALDFAMPPTRGGLLVSQTQILPPGSYRLEGRTSMIDQAERSQPYWVLLCEGRKELGRVEVPNSDTMEGKFSGLLVVPEGCSSQVLQLIARSSDSIEGVTGRIDRAYLKPERRSKMKEAK
ncbi:hypothetical protein [Croceicoccus sp. Ery15]|uniref:hypothetical protein n=1 Tax=Croceicoccus sp. Ery15 TaxID=1703338 RepID=UPI001E2B42D3|nr:hypothetical protein [Croceicoccus sp. Ery15]